MRTLAVLALSLPAFAFAQVSQKLGYQGRLLDAQGVEINNPVNFTFAIYDKEDAKTPIWSEVQQQVKIVNGFYSVFIGDGTTGGVTGGGIPGNVFKQGGERWLGITVGNASEMTPRQKIASVAYAITAQNALIARNVKGDTVETQSVSVDTISVKKASSGITNYWTVGWKQCQLLNDLIWNNTPGAGYQPVLISASIYLNDPNCGSTGGGSSLLPTSMEFYCAADCMTKKVDNCSGCIRGDTSDTHFYTDGMIRVLWIR